MNKTVIKGAIMTLLTFLLTMLTTMPATKTDWIIAGFTLVGTLAGYFVQSALFSTTSLPGDLNWKDAFKGALVALSNLGATVIATNEAGGVINWKALVVSMVGLWVGYILKQYNTPPTA